MAHDPTLPAGVALTAAAMARERQVESARPDALFRDPWAEQLVAAALDAAGDGAPAWLSGGATLGDIVAGLNGYVALRTRWFDDGILAAANAGRISQVVLLAAGLDTRVLRLAWPRPLTVFTLDQPQVVAFVRHRLAGAPPAAGVRWVPVPADLTADWGAALRAAGFVPGAATLWVAEGLLMYLSPESGERVLADARALCGPESHFLADHAHPNALTNALFTPGRRTLDQNSSPLRSAVADPVPWFAGHGWDAVAADPPDLARRHGRHLPAALDPAAPTFWFAHATS